MERSDKVDRFMTKKRAQKFDPKVFLAKIGDGRDINKYRKNAVIFSQGDPADAVFYIQKGKVKLTVVSEQSREAVSQYLEWMISLAKGASRDRVNA